MYCGYVITVKDLRPHPNADKLQLLGVFGTETCVGLDVKLGDRGVYFPTDGQLSEEFCRVHDLVRRKDENGNAAGGFLEPGKRNIKAIKLRGERSDGLYMPISCLEYTGAKLEDFADGDTISIVNKHEICQKYIPRSNKVATVPNGNKVRKHKVPYAPLFAEHTDTEQLAYNLAAFRPGDAIEITLKLHGTSQRTGYLPVLKKMKRSLLDIILRRPGKPVYDWDYVTGTRRTVLEDFDGGFYGSNAFRAQHAKTFEGKLQKGETAYYEVVGFTDTGVPIMPPANNKKLNDKEFIKQYGEETVFSYGCDPSGCKEILNFQLPEQTFVLEDKTVTITNCALSTKNPQSDIYVYRMTLTNEEGFTVEYSPDFMRYRCEQMGVKTVPVFWKGYIPEENEYKRKSQDLVDHNIVYNTLSEGEWVQSLAEQYCDGPDPVGKTHVREGVVVRILNRPKFSAYKLKNFSFKVLEGIIKNDADAPDMEEAEGL